MKCPNCSQELEFNIDGYGRTPYHIHCRNCDINIGTNNQKKNIELLNKYHNIHTYIEYYNNDIQLFYENGVGKIGIS